MTDVSVTTLLASWLRESSSEAVGLCRIDQGTPIEFQTLTRAELATRPLILFPGSFHPLHRAHQQMAQIATSRLPDRQLLFEISLANVDKGSTESDQLIRRLHQPFETGMVALTRVPRFDQKAMLFPNCVFVVGADTMQRIQSQRYYESTEDQQRAFDTIVNHGCRFLVFSRRIDGQLLDSQRIVTHPRLVGVSSAVDTTDFCHDLSSSELRALGRHP